MAGPQAHDATFIHLQGLTFDPSVLNVPAIVEAIRDVGYDVIERPGDHATAEIWSAATRGLKTPGYEQPDYDVDSDELEDLEQLARAAEYRTLRFRFVLGVVLAVPVVVLGMAHVHVTGVNWVQLALATPVLLFPGWQFYRGRGKPCATSRPT